MFMRTLDASKWIHMTLVHIESSRAVKIEYTNHIIFYLNEFLHRKFWGQKMH